MGYADAYSLEWTGEGYEINEDVEFVVYDGYFSHRGWAHSELLRGTVGYAKHFSDSGRWEIISIEQLPERIEVTLTENMGYTTPGYAACTVNNYYRGGRDPSAVYGAIFVCDPQGHYPRALSGAKGMATYDPFCNLYILTECQQVCWMMKATAETVEPGDTVINFSGATVMLPFTGQAPNPLPTQCNNTFGMATSSSGATVLIWWNETTDVWEGFVIDPVWLEPVTDLQYDTSDHKFKEKIIESLVLYKKDEGDWDPWHTAVAASPIDDLRLGSGAIETIDRYLYVLEGGVQTSWVSQITTTECP